MVRNLPHIVVGGVGASREFKARGGGSSKHPSDVNNRSQHAQALLSLLDNLPDVHAEQLPGLYLHIGGRSGEIMITKSLDTSGLELLSVRAPDVANRQAGEATVFATPDGLQNLKKKITEFETEDHKKTKRPKNADLVQSLGLIVEAGLRALWRSPQSRFPEGEGAATWEIWVERDNAETFKRQAEALGVTFGPDQLEFPEEIVFVVSSKPDVLAQAVRRLGTVRALAAPAATTAFFDGMPVEEQLEWTQSLQEKVRFNGAVDGQYLTLLDTGITLGHPLITPALSRADRHVADPAWGFEDVHGHGTQLAGLALYGDMTFALQAIAKRDINFRLESVKIIPDAGENDYELLGAITQRAVNAVESHANRRRVFVMASTTEKDTPHDGAPTSWSTAIDQLAYGTGTLQKRLIVISAGNTDQQRFLGRPYLQVCDDPENEIEAPAQAWNAIAVGAYTIKDVLPPPQRAVAPAGDLSPSSRTASWSSTWPIKPDVVLEGGNWAHYPAPPPLRHDALSLLTTDHRYPQRAFTQVYDTSASTALAGKGIADLWADYPNLWPETIRGLYVGSARWTPQMRSHLGNRPVPLKGSYEPLFRRYGYGVPDIGRARRSASNALTLIIQDVITPYKPGKKGSQAHAHNEFRLFELPWPVKALRALGPAEVRLRVTLSSFIDPNPSEAFRGSRYRYASHNLRFKLSRPNDNPGVFATRVSAAIEADPDDGPVVEEEDGWSFGSNRRDVGSLHIDELICPATDLAKRNLIAVHPVTGWWKAKATPNPENRSVRFALIVEIDSEHLQTDLYTEVVQTIATRNLTLIQG